MHVPSRYQLGIDRDHKLKKKFEKEKDDKALDNRDEDSGYEEGQESSTNNLIELDRKTSTNALKKYNSFG